MRWLWLLMLVGCEKSKPVDDIPTRQIFIGPKGVWVNKEQKIAQFENLDATRVRQILDATPAEPEGGHSIVVDAKLASGDPLAAILEGATRLGWKKLSVAVQREDKEFFRLCDADFRLSTAAAKNEEIVMLSVWVMPERTWIGLSRVNEFQEVPLRAGEQDTEKLEVTLQQHKQSAFFSDREDIEIAFEKGLPLQAHTGTLAAACKSFHELSVMPSKDLAAKPTL
jgi:hypothetical protein